MGSANRIKVNTLKILHAKFCAPVQQMTKLVEFGVKRSDYNYRQKRHSDVEQDLFINF